MAVHKRPKPHQSNFAHNFCLHGGQLCHFDVTACDKARWLDNLNTLGDWEQCCWSVCFVNTQKQKELCRINKYFLFEIFTISCFCQLFKTLQAMV